MGFDVKEEIMNYQDNVVVRPGNDGGAASKIVESWELKKEDLRAKDITDFLTSNGATPNPPIPVEAAKVMVMLKHIAMGRMGTEVGNHPYGDILNSAFLSQSPSVDVTQSSPSGPNTAPTVVLPTE